MVTTTYHVEGPRSETGGVDIIRGPRNGIDVYADGQRIGLWPETAREVAKVLVQLADEIDRDAEYEEPPSEDELTDPGF